MSKVDDLRRMREAKFAKQPTGKAARSVPYKDVAKSDGLTGRRDDQEPTLIAEKLTKAIAAPKKRGRPKKAKT